MSYSSRLFLETREFQEMNPETEPLNSNPNLRASAYWQEYLDRIGEDKAIELENQYQRWLQHRSENG